MHQEEVPHKVGSRKSSIDSDALFRQLAVYGHECQKRLMSMRVLIHGVKGVYNHHMQLGIQVAKNIILAGPKHVGIFDSTIVSVRDLGYNFYLKEEHIGKVSRSEGSQQQLKSLNPSVNVEVVKDDSIPYMQTIYNTRLQHYDIVVVLDNYGKKYISQLNIAMREAGKGFILGGNLGLYGYTFVDFGDAHIIADRNGEQPKLVHIAGITQEKQALVCLHEGKRHDLEDGDVIVFKQVQGMTQLNGGDFVVKVKSPMTFTIDQDTTGFNAYVGGGIANEVKMPFEMKFKSFADSLRDPYALGTKQLPTCSWEKIGLPQRLHIILNGLYNYYQKYNSLPRVLSNQDARILELEVKQHLSQKMDIEGTPAYEQYKKITEVQSKLIHNISKYAITQISACCSFWGGIITQEIIKMTGKFTPLHQWLHHQFLQLLPEDENVERSISNDSRYIDYQILFGNDFVRKCAESRAFIVGAGALGCEFIKMFALMGMGRKNRKGELICTDDDSIQISNLNRQFLFRKQHVGSNKCQVACKIGQTINHDINFRVMKARVSEQNSNVFNSQFWQATSFVVNAVDNIKARNYIDSQCVWYEKAFFESGTLGTKCHSQTIIPHATISYTDQMDPPEQTVPLCTLKNFPYQIQHTIQWARDYFEGEIAQPSTNIHNYYENPQAFIQNLEKQYKLNPTILLDKLSNIYQLKNIYQSKSLEKCVQLAVNMFEKIFHHQIRQLTEAFPIDHINDETKKNFWSGLKRFPTAIPFKVDDPTHFQFVQAATNIYATMLNISNHVDKKIIYQIAKNLKLPQYKKSSVKIQTEDKTKLQNKIDIKQEDQNQIKKLKQILIKQSKKTQQLPKMIPFEKDDPTNYHIQFVSSISNLRARNYQIQEIDKFRVKLIAGKIIPAIATATATIVGAVGLQIIKLLMDKKPQLFKNVTINLALPVFVFNECVPAIINEDAQFNQLMNGPIKVLPKKFTKWDKIDIKGPLTLEQFVQHLEKTLKFQISMVTYGSSSLYMSFMPPNKQRAKMRIEDIIRQNHKCDLQNGVKYIALEVSGTLNNIECRVPTIRYSL